ncbi:RNA polymerase sigma factor [Desulfosarcina sp.]|uniref:RNA polymerase sigma factor n=1 Tax=Desulfosarcina sp. TaxID=2027861 RepID=UPI0029B48F73|nr:RNA polymerase sigma factor [Desulfosarcina sp.]MDX2454747.1 RNA polymerase sigma factor [Desulfosarcina sp.]
MPEDKLAEQTDTQLMNRIASGETIYLGELYRRHNRKLKAALYHWVPEMTQEDIEDVCQEVFIALGKTAKNYKDISKFKSWLYKIASNKALSWRRNTAVRRRLFKMYTSNKNIESDSVAASRADTTSMRQVAWQMLTKLPYEQRQVLWLHLVEGFDGDEIAETMGINRSTVYSRINRARNKLMSDKNATLWKNAMNKDRQ